VLSSLPLRRRTMMALVQVDVVPPQVARLADAQAMPIDQQADEPIPLIKCDHVKSVLAPAQGATLPV
jgi:hypothetical protein